MICSLHGNVPFSIHIFSVYVLKQSKECIIGLSFHPWTISVTVIIFLYTCLLLSWKKVCLGKLFFFTLVVWWRYILLLHGPLFLFIITVLLCVDSLQSWCCIAFVSLTWLEFLFLLEKLLRSWLNSKFYLPVCIFRVSIGWLMTYVVSGALVLGNNFWSVFSYLFYLTTLSGRMTEKLP